MFFKNIHIDGFGIFNDFSLAGLKKGVNIILGNNEVGKSTLLKFLRFTLFGYPSRTDKRMAPLKGGGHGGRIISYLSTGKEVIFKRVSGAGGGNFELTVDNETGSERSEWYSQLGNATRELYNNVYAFSLDELVNLQSLSDSGVEDKIFSVGLGLGNISLKEVEKDIQSITDDIYTRRGSIQLVPKILNEMQRTKTEIQKIQGNLPHYKKLTQEIDRHEIEIKKLEDELNKLDTEKGKLDNYLKCHKNFVEISAIDKDLESLPELQNFPDGGIVELNSLEVKEKDAEKTIKKLHDDIEKLKEEKSTISFNSALLGKEGDVDYIRKNFKLYKQTVKDKEEDDKNIKEANETIRAALEKIGSNWKEKDIEAFNDIIFHENKIEEYRGKIEDIESERITLDAEYKALKYKESAFNGENIAKVLASIFFIGSIPAFFYSLHILGAALIIIAIVLFFSKKHIQKKIPLEKIEQQLSDIDASKKKVEEEYGNYLKTSININLTLSIESVKKILTVIKETKKEIDKRDALLDKQEGRIKFIDEFESVTTELEKILAARQTRKSLDVLVDKIFSEFDTAKKLSARKDALIEKVDIEKEELEKLKNNLKDIRTEISALLKSIKAEDRKDFREKYQKNNEVKELAKKRKIAVQTIETIVGVGKSETVLKYLQSNEKQNLEIKIKENKRKINDKAEKLKLIQKESAKKERDKEELEGGSALSTVLTGFETSKEKLNNAYKDWLSGKIALKILKEVKQNYERKKQPEVIKLSSQYFRTITNGRYDSINVSLEDREVSIFVQGEASKKIGRLSRGTKEQLLISLRLGFIEEYERKNEPLPVIMDEILVNFDPNRVRKMAKVLYEFSKNRQILLFTCHPTTAKHFENMDIKVINIK